MSTDKITCLLNWHATPYHLPLFLAEKLNYFADQGIKVAILEPSNPSDVTEVIGSGKVDLGCKAMIHTIAGKARGFPIKSIGTLFGRAVHRRCRIGYVGEFGKIQLDELTRQYGMTPSDYEAVRVGMNVTGTIIRGDIHAGIGPENVQMVELEEWSVHRAGLPMMSRCFASMNWPSLVVAVSILFIGDEPSFIDDNPEKVRAFMAAVKQGTDYMLAHPAQAYELFLEMKPHMDSQVIRKIFQRSFRYMSHDMKNVQRDWDKVTKYCKYCKRLEIVDEGFVQNQTNEFLTWDLNPESPPGYIHPTVDTGVLSACRHGHCSMPVKSQAA